MNVDKSTFAWGKGCFMRCMGSCTVVWDGGGRGNNSTNQKNRRTIINGEGLLCDAPASEVKQGSRKVPIIV